MTKSFKVFFVNILIVWMFNSLSAKKIWEVFLFAFNWILWYLFFLSSLFLLISFINISAFISKEWPFLFSSTKIEILRDRNWYDLFSKKDLSHRIWVHKIRKFISQYCRISLQEFIKKLGLLKKTFWCLFFKQKNVTENFQIV